MGTVNSGLLRWRNGVLSHVYVKDGLYDSRIYAIISDDHSNLWMASSKGIFRVSLRELNDFSDGKIRSVLSIPFTTGQLRFECRSGVRPAAIRARDGRLWFSTTNGVVVVDPGHLTDNATAPPVQITALLVNGQRVEPDPNMHLQPHERHLEVRYAGLSFISPEKVTFRYMLDGYDKNWTDAGTRREAFFTNLPPGDFHFKVMARNADGVWSTQAASVPFTVEPLLYQRRWFFPALALLITSLVAAGYRIRVRTLQSKFDLVLAERSRIARELHDTLLQGLSGITMQLQALWTRLPVSNEKITLAEIIKDAGACATEARQSLWGLRVPDAQDPVFSDRVAKLAREMLAGSQLDLNLHLDPTSLPERPETEYQLLRIVQEAISNVLKHARAQTLRVDLLRHDGQLLLRVQDDGHGFESTAAGDGFGHFGMRGLRERAAEIGASIVIESGPGGTQIQVRLPVRSALHKNERAVIAEEHQLQ